MRWMNNHSNLLAAVLCLSAVGVGRAAAAPRDAAVGDPNNPGALATAIQAAYDGGARRITIRRGTYFLPNVGHSAIPLKGWQDATISARGVTLILTDLKWGHNLFDLQDCTRVTVEGPTLSQNSVTAYQGRVVATGTGTDGKFYADWRPDAGYPVPPADSAKFPQGDANVVDAHTRRLKVGVGDFYGVAMDPANNGVYRVHFREPQENIAVGDWLVGRYGDAPFKVYLGNCRDCTIRDVTMMRNGFAPLREDRGGGNHYLHITWKLGPRPAGATEDPLVTNAADGMHMIGSYPGPDVENCIFEGVFLDDCIAIHGSLQTVKSGNGNTLVLEKGIGALMVGQPVRASDNHGYFAEATVTALRKNEDGTATVTLDKPINVPAGAKLSNPLTDGAGYKIIGCRLGDTRSRGMLLKSDDGLVQGNTVEGCGMSAVSLGPEYYWGEGDYVRHVTVIGNTFRGNGQAYYGGATVWVHGDGAIGNRDITIAKNQFDSDFQGAVKVEWTDGAAITGNHIAGPAQWPASAPNHPPIALEHDRNVALKDNVVTTPAAFPAPLLVTGPDVITVTGNGTDGILARPGE